MRYTYSILKYVPDPVRGEFINIGALLGSEESNEWRLKIVDNYSRAKKIDEGGILPLVLEHLSTLAAEIDDFTSAQESLYPPEKEINLAWLADLHQSSQNILQFSLPTPIVSASIDDAANLLFEEFIVEPEFRKYPFKKKTEATASLRRTFLDKGLQKGKDYFEKIEVAGRHHSESFDFAVANGKVLQLSQAWSFQLPGERQLVEEIKGWAYSVEDLRYQGGQAITRERKLTVGPDIPIYAIYVPPKLDQSRAAFDEAMCAFEKVGVKPVSFGDTQSIGDEAASLKAG